MNPASIPNAVSTPEVAASTKVKPRSPSEILKGKLDSQRNHHAAEEEVEGDPDITCLVGIPVIYSARKVIKELLEHSGLDYGETYVPMNYLSFTGFAMDLVAQRGMHAYSRIH